MIACEYLARCLSMPREFIRIALVNLYDRDFNADKLEISLAEANKELACDGAF